ncbi:Putative protein of unknown function [Podospora comata]|uniref:Uncharacterized protein n=1 Tax=Podospora comata TaxID=48703 RepID=A0ABY6S2K4_PODCO|nr:Putative protein of unknown function [Podospora comata]
MLFTTASALAATLFAGLVSAQTPVGFTPAVEAKLEVIYGTKATIEPGTRFTKTETARQPTIGTSDVALNGTYVWLLIGMCPFTLYMTILTSPRPRPLQLPKPLLRPPPHQPPRPHHGLQILRADCLCCRRQQPNLHPDILLHRSHHLRRSFSSGRKPPLRPQIRQPVVRDSRRLHRDKAASRTDIRLQLDHIRRHCWVDSRASEGELYQCSCIGAPKQPCLTNVVGS